MDVWGAFLPDWLLFPLDIYLSFYFLRDVIKISFFKPSLNKTLLKGLLNYGLKVFMIGLLERIILRVDVFFVNYYQSPAAVGLYMTGVSYTEFIRLIPSAVGTVLFARVSATREEEAKNLTTLITRTYIIFIPLLSVFLLLLAHIIIPLFYGARFIPSIGVVGYLLPGVIALCFASPLGQYLNGRGFPEFNLYAGAMGVFLTLVGDFLLIPKMGIKGAALVSSIAYIATFLILLHFFHSYTKASLKEIFSPRKEDMLYILQVFKEKLASIKRKELK
jgi:O-antigen/teichoic acid export membrane protein